VERRLHRAPIASRGSQPGCAQFRRCCGTGAKGRKRIELGERPAFVLLRVLEEDCGIRSSIAPSSRPARRLREERTDGWAILLNAGNAECRRNFDLAHELFHLLVWDLYRGAGAANSQVSPEQEEKLANAFASHLLIPADALRRTVDRKRNAEGKISVSAIPQIADSSAYLWRR